MLTKLVRALYALLVTVVLLLTVLTVGMLLWLTRSGYLLSVASPSMAPTFRPGDAVVVRYVSPTNLLPGQILSYKSSIDPKVVISHRLVSKTDSELITKGDNLLQDDDPVVASQVIGRVVAVSPKLGYVMDFVKNPVGLSLTVYVPALLVITGQIIQLFSYYSQPFYRLASR